MRACTGARLCALRRYAATRICIYLDICICVMHACVGAPCVTVHVRIWSNACGLYVFMYNWMLACLIAFINVCVYIYIHIYMPACIYMYRYMSV
jgi:hypothetical protein